MVAISQKILGKDLLLIRTFDKFHDNIFYFKNGVKCGVYNKMSSAKLVLECGDDNLLVFVTKNECEYEFRYNTKLACNNFYLMSNRRRFSQYFKDLEN